MQKLLYFIIILLFSSCIYKSVITSSKIKRSIILQNKHDTLPFNSTNSILTNNVDLETLKFLNGKREKGLLSIFLTKGDTYVEAKSNYISRDSVSFNGIILYNDKRDTIHFVVSFRPTLNIISFVKIQEHSYSVKIQPSAGSFGDSSIRFNLRKFQNFIIKEDVLDLTTGELQKENGKTTKFVILNDVVKPDFLLASLWVTDFISDPDYKEYVRQCKDRENKKLIPICKTGYDLDWKFNWLKYDVICKCYD